MLHSQHELQETVTPLCEADHVRANFQQRFGSVIAAIAPKKYTGRLRRRYAGRGQFGRASWPMSRGR
jgi:hypothetical protein